MKKHLGELWFLIHFALEIICYQFYYFYFGNAVIAGLLALIYDILAFAPQLFISALAEKFPKMSCGIVGAVMVLVGGACGFVPNETVKITGFLVLSLGNAFVHVGGAEATVYRCQNKIAPSAIFISGGALGVVTGRLLGQYSVPFIIGWLIMLVFSALIPLSDKFKGERITPAIKMADAKKPVPLIIFMAFFVVSVRGLLSYGIPMGWNKGVLHTILLFSMMALGKALGGIISDILGAKKTALISTGLSLPFILLGGENMWLSLFGIALFSMTTATTLGILISATPKHPVVAYGISVTGLLIGSLPAAVPSVKGFISNEIVLSAFTIICFVMLWFVMSPDKKPVKKEVKENVA